MKRIVAVFLAMGAVVGAQAADIEAGKAKAQQVCAACHGADGNSQNPDFPRLAGQYDEYLVQALKDYQSGKRKNAIMAPVAQTLSKEDVHNVAAYFAEQASPLYTKK